MTAVGHQESLGNGSYLVAQRGREPIILAASADNRWLVGLPEAVWTSYALSQVVLAFQLPFVILPLVTFSRDKAKMGALAALDWLTLVAEDWTCKRPFSFPIAPPNRALDAFVPVSEGGTDC
jgi:hypothetical protein